MRSRVSRFFDRSGRAQIFALVADVEAYPEFLPLCRATKILARGKDRLRVENDFGLGPMRLRFETEAVLTPPRAIRIRSADPAFRVFRIDWLFVDERGGCRAECDMELVFRNPGWEWARRISARPAIAAAIEAFARRAAAGQARAVR